MNELLVVPLGYPFVVRALLAVTMVAAVCALVGTFAVLRGMSYIGTALAHSHHTRRGGRLPGDRRDCPATSLFWWASATAILSSLGMATLVRRGSASAKTPRWAWCTPACSRWAS